MGIMQRLPAPADKPWCERCGEDLRHGEDAIRTDGPTHWRRSTHDARDAWWHVDCHASAFAEAVERADEDAARLGVTLRDLARGELNQAKVTA